MFLSIPSKFDKKTFFFPRWDSQQPGFNRFLAFVLQLFQQYSQLLKAFTSQGLSELSLLLKIQEYCYDNIHFMKAFQKIVVLLYKSISFFTSTCVQGRNVYLRDTRWLKIDRHSLNFGAFRIVLEME